MNSVQLQRQLYITNADELQEKDFDGADVALSSIEGYNLCEVKTFDRRNFYARGIKDSKECRGANVA